MDKDTFSFQLKDPNDIHSINTSLLLDIIENQAYQTLVLSFYLLKDFLINTNK